MTENERAPGGEVFRYSRDGDVRIYSLRVAAGGTELWRVTVVPGEPDSAILEEHFKSAEVAGQYFEEIERALIAGGWREVSHAIISSQKHASESTAVALTVQSSR